MSDCENVTLANLFNFRVVGMRNPYNEGVILNSCKNLHFRNVHVYGQSKYSFDSPIVNKATNTEIRYREIASLDVSGERFKPQPAGPVAGGLPRGPR